MTHPPNGQLVCWAVLEGIVHDGGRVRQVLAPPEREMVANGVPWHDGNHSAEGPTGAEI